VERLSESSLSSSLLVPPAPPDTSVVVSVSEVIVEEDFVVSKVVDLVNGGSLIEIISVAEVVSSSESVETSSLVVDRIFVLVVGLGITGGDDVSITKVVGSDCVVLEVSRLNAVVDVITGGKVTTPLPEGSKTNVAVIVRCVGRAAFGLPLQIAYARSTTRSGFV
jgi:hypothetical protein